VDSEATKKRLTPAELFDHRLASLLGRTVDEMKAALSQREYLSWQLYWSEEPWGPFRDNLHAAIIAREVRRRYLKKGARSSLDDFMVVDPETRYSSAAGKMIEMLKVIAVQKPRPT
jgi:hypothetical protein